MQEITYSDGIFITKTSAIGSLDLDMEGKSFLTDTGIIGGARSNVDCLRSNGMSCQPGPIA